VATAWRILHGCSGITEKESEETKRKQDSARAAVLPYSRKRKQIP
jgi:hypothetical protein